jgi:hypothetical protein
MGRPATGQGTNRYIPAKLLPTVNALLGGHSIGGIFAIKNTWNHQIYIASTIDITTVWQQHQSWLKQGQHPDPDLQMVWNIAGTEVFTFVVLDIVEDLRNLSDRELAWIESCTKLKRSTNER